MTRDCISSLYAHVKLVSFELIVVDNGSTYGDLSGLEKINPGLSTIFLSENIGFAKGNNVGISRAKGKYILLLNNDTLFTDDCVSPILEYLKANPSVGVGTCQLTHPNGVLQHNCQRFPSIKYKFLELLRVQKVLGKRLGGKLLLGGFFDHKELVYPDWVWGTFFMFPKKILTEFTNHKLPETFFMYWEDVEWCREIKMRGYHIAFIPSASITHIMGGSSGNKSELMVKNEKIFLANYYNQFERTIINFLDKMLVK